MKYMIMKKEKITFNKLIPMPKELENSIADGSTTIKRKLCICI